MGRPINKNGFRLDPQRLNQDAWFYESEGETEEKVMDPKTGLLILGAFLVLAVINGLINGPHSDAEAKAQADRFGLHGEQTGMIEQLRKE